ncbi:hypothetical protein [Almyronema epifaneia]|uniref:Uncharacterized protein n=1 Tax=Almyronema epifaneia S1 TaxID=2991925 RepID=A0ABW6IJ04_9CYAN
MTQPPAQTSVSNHSPQPPTETSDRAAKANTDQSAAKDIWDIVGIVGGFLPTLLLGIIPFIITDRITTSLETGRFTQSLIQDLASNQPDTKLRQDVALVALDRSVGCGKDDTVDTNERCILVAEIAEQIYLNSLGSEVPEEQKLKSLSFKILERRHGQRANQLRQDSRTQAAAEDVAVVQNSPTPAAETPVPTQSAQLLARTQPSVVYLQVIYQTEPNRDLAASLQAAIQTDNVSETPATVSVPEIEFIQGDNSYQDSIRYFNPADRETAFQLKALIENFFASQAELSGAKRFQVLDFTQSTYTAPVGQFEVWVNFN